MLTSEGSCSPRPVPVPVGNRGLQVTLSDFLAGPLACVFERVEKCSLSRLLRARGRRYLFLRPQASTDNTQINCCEVSFTTHLCDDQKGYQLYTRPILHLKTGGFLLFVP